MLKINNLGGFGRIIPSAGGYDADAETFFTATGITDSTQKSAVDTLVTDLKGYSIWTKMTAIYPFVGGSSSTHAVNLKNPGTYDITWSGTVTHDSNGITGNGSDGYGNTNITPSTHLTENDTHLSIYSRTSAAGNVYEIGSTSGGAVDFLDLQTRASGDIFRFTAYQTASGTAISNTDGQGFYIGSRRTVSDLEAYKNGSSVGTNTASDTKTRPSAALTICARNNAGTPAGFSTKNIAFASVGLGLTDTEASNFYTAVQAYQTTLSRNV